MPWLDSHHAVAMCMAWASFTRLEYSLAPLALTNAVLYGGVETKA